MQRPFPFFSFAFVLGCLTKKQAIANDTEKPCLRQITIDFSHTAMGSSRHHGQLVNDTVSFHGGVTFGAQSVYGQNDGDLYNDAVIVDASLFDGPGDLSQPQQSNVLVVTKDGKFETPDDKKRGGEIFIHFQVPTTVVSLASLDSDNFGNRIELYDGNNTKLNLIHVPRGKDGSLQTVEISTSNVKVMRVFTIKFAAIDDLVFVRECPPGPENTPVSSPTAQPNGVIPTPGTTVAFEPSSSVPSCKPKIRPTRKPTFGPSSTPTFLETSDDPTRPPISEPTGKPTLRPLANPTLEPTMSVFEPPSSVPTIRPTRKPTFVPSVMPTFSETSDNPTRPPTSEPTVKTTLRPSSDPTANPSRLP